MISLFKLKNLILGTATVLSIFASTSALAAAGFCSYPTTQIKQYNNTTNPALIPPNWIDYQTPPNVIDPLVNPTTGAKSCIAGYALKSNYLEYTGRMKLTGLYAWSSSAFGDQNSEQGLRGTYANGNDRTWIGSSLSPNSPEKMLYHTASSPQAACIAMGGTAVYTMIANWYTYPEGGTLSRFYCRAYAPDGPVVGYISTQAACTVGSYIDPLGYISSNCSKPPSAKCVLSNPSLVKKPRNGVCNQIPINGIMSNDPKDPDCLTCPIGANPKGAPKDCAGS